MVEPGEGEPRPSPRPVGGVDADHVDLAHGRVVGRRWTLVQQKPARRPPAGRRPVGVEHQEALRVEPRLGHAVVRARRCSVALVGVVGERPVVHLDPGVLVVAAGPEGAHRTGRARRGARPRPTAAGGAAGAVAHSPKRASAARHVVAGDGVGGEVHRPAAIAVRPARPARPQDGHRRRASGGDAVGGGDRRAATAPVRSRRPRGRRCPIGRRATMSPPAVTEHVEAAGAAEGTGGGDAAAEETPLPARTRRSASGATANPEGPGRLAEVRPTPEEYPHGGASASSTTGTRSSCWRPRSSRRRPPTCG